ncbi:SMAD/FHA domain-containing protein [Salvia divinorum]|uniref:SMAD/FHA domain-containing protein n=1 Tax=Salvia divinorum TaxID=28513 RepID=A0ABD1HU04_SALDI
MYGRAGLDRFRKAQTSEPFAVTANSGIKTAMSPALREAVHPTAASANQAQGSYLLNQHQNSQNIAKRPFPMDVPLTSVPTQHATPVGGGQSTWQPPDWAIEPRHGVYYLEVLKDGESGGIYDDVYGESLSVKVGSSWAHKPVASGSREASPSIIGRNTSGSESTLVSDDDDDDDLFG